MKGMFHHSKEIDGWLPIDLFTQLKYIQAPVLTYWRHSYDHFIAKQESMKKKNNQQQTAVNSIQVVQIQEEEELDSNTTSTTFNHEDYQNFQKKITTGAQAILESLDNNGRIRDLLKKKVSDVKNKQKLIILASLVEKIPNLGGLTRTSEIFNIEELAINSIHITKNSTFEKVSVTAADWVNIVEVKPDYESMAKYMKQKKALGYTIIGLEQTANSIHLQHYTFPDKVVLLLGKEREGTPIELLNLVDQCIEIPQFGLIRSLNVHVSASLLIWEVTRQRLLAKKIAS